MIRMLGSESTRAKTLKNLNLILFYSSTHQEKTSVEIPMVNLKLKLIGNGKFHAE